MIIRTVGQIVGFFTGTLISPFWTLLSMVVKPYFDLHKAGLSPNDMASEIFRFQAITQANPNLIFGYLLPVLVLIGIGGALFSGAMGRFGGWVALYLAAKLRNAQPAA